MRGEWVASGFESRRLPWPPYVRVEGTMQLSSFGGKAGHGIAYMGPETEIRSTALAMEAAGWEQVAVHDNREEADFWMAERGRFSEFEDRMRAEYPDEPALATASTLAVGDVVWLRHRNLAITVRKLTDFYGAWYLSFDSWSVGTLHQDDIVSVIHRAVPRMDLP